MWDAGGKKKKATPKSMGEVGGDGSKLPLDCSSCFLLREGSMGEEDKVVNRKVTMAVFFLFVVSPRLSSEFAPGKNYRFGSSSHDWCWRKKMSRLSMPLRRSLSLRRGRDFGLKYEAKVVG